MQTESFMRNLCRGIACAVSLAAAAQSPAAMPAVTHVNAVAPDVIEMKIRDGEVRYGRQEKYVRRAGDTIKSPPPGTDIPHRWIHRDGKVIGALVGPEGNLRQTFDTLVGGTFDMDWSDSPRAYTISSVDDERYARPVRPRKVFRKSVPTDLARLDDHWTVAAAKEHTLYLKLRDALRPGSTYQLNFAEDRLPAQVLHHQPMRARSEAVHVSQLGFRPDDPAKVAFVSTWMGTGGGLEYPPGMKFAVIDEHTDEVVHSGKAQLSKAADDRTEDAYKRNYNGTDVHLLDFSGVTRPGTYRVCVAGIGCSFTFEIADDAWTKAFVVSVRGLYHQRSGIELGPPYTTYQRPRAFNPEDGMKVYRARASLIETFKDGQEDPGRSFELLRKTVTDEVVPEAWGGWMDAGDWDRRITHLAATRYLIDLADLFPERLGRLSLNIPESGGKLPDIVDEALFCLDLYRRLQAEDGGVSGGIDSFQHPRYGEASWQESLEVAVYSPGVWSSHVYAATAAQAARYLEPLAPERAEVYRTTAIRAMRWAEKHYRDGQYHHLVYDTRNLAAAELYRLTGDDEWHELFLRTTVFTRSGKSLTEWKKYDQAEAAWVYLRTTHAGVDRGVQDNARSALLAEADSRVAQGRKTGFRWTKFPYFPPFMFPIPQGVELLRAHSLTGERKYLEALVLSTQFGAGANPMNLVFTTGLGQRSPQHPLQADHRISHQPPPPGLTLFGPVPKVFGAFTEPYKHLIKPYAVPDDYDDWPGVESYWDVYWFIAMDEYMIHQTMAPTFYAWGYLAGRP